MAGSTTGSPALVDIDNLAYRFVAGGFIMYGPDDGFRLFLVQSGEGELLGVGSGGGLVTGLLAYLRHLPASAGDHGVAGKKACLVCFNRSTHVNHKLLGNTVFDGDFSLRFQNRALRAKNETCHNFPPPAVRHDAGCAADS